MRISAFPKQVAVYTVVILGTIVYSSDKVEKTLYDKYIVYFEGINFPVSDPKLALSFYGDFLDFSPRSPSRIERLKLMGLSEIVDSISVTPRSQLSFSQLPANPAAQARPTLTVRVRNGIEKLHAELVRRKPDALQQVRPEPRPPAERSEVTTIAETLLPARVSQLITTKESSYFYASDPEGNRILFFKPKRKLL